MKKVTLTISTSFEKTHSLDTYGSDGSKHRIGAYGGDSCYYLNNVDILPFERTVSRNSYSGRIQRGTRYSKFDIENVDIKIKNFLQNFINENKFTTGKNFLKFQEKIIEIFQKRDFEDLNQLPTKQVFSRKEISINFKG